MILSPESLSLAASMLRRGWVSEMDRVACLWIAVKFEETSYLHPDDFLQVLSIPCDKEALFRSERAVLEAFQHTVPFRTPMMPILQEFRTRSGDMEECLHILVLYDVETLFSPYAWAAFLTYLLSTQRRMFKPILETCCKQWSGRAPPPQQWCLPPLPTWG